MSRGRSKMFEKTKRQDKANRLTRHFIARSLHREFDENTNLREKKEFYFTSAN